METRFRTLRFVAGLFKVLAWIMLVGGVIGAVGVIIAGITGAGDMGGRMSDLTGLAAGGVAASIAMGVGLILAALLEFVLLYAAGDMISLGLAIEENTRETAVYMRGDAGAPPYAR